MRIRGIIGAVFLLSSLLLSGQNFNKNDFFEADMALVSNDYERAQKIFQRLLKSEPENANLNFLNGLCLINIPGRKKESINYFKLAALKASADYKYGSAQETNSPLEVVKYYAMASKLNNDISRAIELLNQYKSLLDSKEKDEIALTNAMLESCYAAQKMQRDPVFYKKIDLGNNLVSNESQLYPVVNNDETMLFYAVKGRFEKDEIYFSRKVGSLWGSPVKITIPLGVKNECYPSAVSYDNERLYLTVKEGMNTDIYYSVFKKDQWQKMIKMDKPINSKDWDSHAYESSDGKTIYFSSDRKGGFGNMDLYSSEKDSEGNWMKPINLGGSINTDKNELLPVVNYDQTKIFFKSEAHENAGGYDIFVSERTGDNEWGQPVNIGYPLSTPDDDIYFMPVQNGNFAFTTFEDINNPGKYNLSYIEIFSENNPRKFNISGFILLQDGADSFDNTSIDVYSTVTYEKILSMQPEKLSGSFSFEISSGSYMANFIKPDYKTYTQLFDLPVNNPGDALVINPLLEKVEPLAAEIPPAAVIAEVEENYAEKIMVNEINTEVEVEIQPAEIPEHENPQLEVITPNERIKYPVESGYNGKYTIQFMASLKEIELTTIGDNHIVEIQKGDDKYYRYIAGVFNSISDAENTQKEIVKTKYKNAFIRYYNLDDYLNKASGPSSGIYTIQLAALEKEAGASAFKGLVNLKLSYGSDGFFRYTTGQFQTLSAAQAELRNLISQGYLRAFIKKIDDVSNYR